VLESTILTNLHNFCEVVSLGRALFRLLK
jgi:hypothetical protein